MQLAREGNLPHFSKLQVTNGSGDVFCLQSSFDVPATASFTRAVYDRFFNANNDYKTTFTVKFWCAVLGTNRFNLSEQSRLLKRRIRRFIEYNRRTSFEFTTRTDSSFRIYTVYFYTNSSSLLTVITHLWANRSPSPHSSYEDHILFHNGCTFGVDC